MILSIHYSEHVEIEGGRSYAKGAHHYHVAGKPGESLSIAKMTLTQ